MRMSEEEYKAAQMRLLRAYESAKKRTSGGSGEATVTGTGRVPLTPAKRREIEHQEQRALVFWARCMEKRIPELKTLHANPMGRYRPPAEAGKIKAEGGKAGMPDLCLPVRSKCGRYNNLFIEMKAPGGKQSSIQDTVAQELREVGARVEVCETHESGRRAILEHLGLETEG